ncbi:TetR/AcrR family transcriptional regulator [Priestia megaterium]
MKEKEKRIIEASIKLFAKKGFNATSVQEIVDECNISKGAFYLHFKSKDALLLSILNFYYEKLFSSVYALDEEVNDARSRYMNQLIYFYEFITEHRDFIIMQIREKSIPFNKEVETFVHKMQRETFYFHRKSLVSVYGEDVTPYISDLTKMIEGIHHSFLEIIIFNQYELTFKEVAHYIMDRVDVLVEDLLARKPRPLIPASFGEDIYGKERTTFLSKNEQVKQVLEEIKDLLDTSDHISDEHADSFHILQTELKKDKPTAAIVKGMVGNLTELKPLEEPLNLLTALLQQK